MTRSNQAFLVQRSLLDEKGKKTKQETFRNTKAEGNEKKKQNKTLQKLKEKKEREETTKKERKTQF